MVCVQARDSIDAIPLFLDAHRSISEQLDEAKAAHSGLRAILLTTPNNPTGEVLQAEGEARPGSAASSQLVQCRGGLKPRLWATAPAQASPLTPDRMCNASVAQCYAST